MESERIIANGIIPLAEYEPQRINRPSIHDILDAVEVCEELQRLDSERLESFIPWDPLHDESFDDLSYGKSHKTLHDYYLEYGTSDTAETLDDLPVSERDEFENQIRTAVYTVQRLHEVIYSTLTSEPSEGQVNQRALKEMLQAFMARYPNDGYFADPDEITFGDIRDFMYEYRQEMVGKYVTDTESPGAIFQERESAESILVEQSRSAFISSLDRLKEQGLVDDEQLERARRIAADIPITATDPLSEVMSKPHDEEEHSLGYFLPSDRTIFINPALIRYAIDYDFPYVDDAKRNQIFERTVASTVFHELVHSISNGWYSIVTQQGYDDSGEKEDATTNYRIQRLFPRFMHEALTEIIGYELFTNMYGTEPEDYHTYPIERDIVQTMLERFDWSGSGATDDTPDSVSQKLKRAFLDSPSGLDDSKRPLETYIEWAKSLKVANAPGIIQRMATIDEQFGAHTLHRIVTSTTFTPGKDELKFDGLLTSKTLRSLQRSARMPKNNLDTVIDSMPPYFAKNYLRDWDRRERAQQALGLYRTVRSLIKTMIDVQYPAPGGLKEDEYLYGVIADAQLRTVVPRLRDIIQDYRDAGKDS